MKHVKELTQSFQAIPPERFREKAGRTVAGVFLVVLGAALLYGTAHGWFGKTPALEWVGIGAIGLGGVTASYEFISAPVRFAVAIGKDVANIVIGILTRQKVNGGGDGAV